MKKVTKTFLNLLLIFVLSIPLMVNADSGLDANYDSKGSMVEAGFSSASSGISIVSELIKDQPGDKGYNGSHIAVSVICIILFYVFTNIYVFKLLRNKNKKAITILAINLIPTILFSLLCLLTELQLVLYFFITAIYIFILMITTKIIIKTSLKRKMKKAKKIDNNFNKEEFDKEAFNTYKEIQLAWMNFELKKLKGLVCKEIYNKYHEQLEKLKTDKQKNIMEKINFKSNKITDIKIENNIEIIECEMKVTCYDYIVDSEEKVVKGKDDKLHSYVYRLVFERDLKTNKYILVKKKLLKQK